MESTLEEVIAELQGLLQKAKIIQARYMGQILALERIVNMTHKTVPQILKKQLPKKEEIKQQISREQVESKVDAFLNEIDLKQKSLQNEPKPKFEIKPPEIVVQKKPPIPTLNRNEKVVKNFTPAYIPPKNKNQVTGKVTQTTIKTSNQKVFKPELTGIKRNASREAISDKSNLSKTRHSMQSKPQKKEQKRQMPVVQRKVEQRVQQTAMKQEKATNLLARSNQKQRAIQVKQNPSFKLATFRKDANEMLQQMFSKGRKNRKQILQKMIKEYENQQLGYKKNEQSSRATFIKHAYNYCASKNHINPVATHRISRRKWLYYPQLFQLNLVLQNLEHQLKGLGNIKEYRIDPKQQFKLVQTTYRLSEIVTQIDEAKGIVPDQLQLTFSHSQVSPPVNQDDDFHKLAQVQLNGLLLKTLEDIASSNTLQKSQLRGLQVLSELGVFKSKKTPIMLPQNDYEQWRNYYFS